MKLYLKCVVVCNLILLSSCINHSPVSKVPKELHDDLASQYYSDKDLIAWQIYLSKRFNLNDKEKYKHYSTLIYALENELGVVNEWNNGSISHGKIRTLTSYKNESNNLCKTYEFLITKYSSKNNQTSSACYVKNKWIFYK